MQNQQNRVVIGILSFGLFMIFVSFFSFYNEAHHFVDTYYLTPIFAAFGLIVGGFIYFYMSQRIEAVKHDYKKMLKNFLGYLDTDERLIVERLLENGEAIQSELSREIGKVRVHRAIRKLRLRNLLKIEPYGKTNKIRLS